MSHSNSTELEEIRSDATVVAKILKDEADIDAEDSRIVNYGIDMSIPDQYVLGSRYLANYSSSNTRITLSIITTTFNDINEFRTATSISSKRYNMIYSGLHCEEIYIVLQEGHYTMEFVYSNLEEMSTETEAIADILKGEEVKELTLFLLSPQKPFFDIKVEESIGDPTIVTIWSDSTQLPGFQFTVRDYVRLRLKYRPQDISGVFRCTKCVREPSKVKYTFELVSSLEE